MTYSLLDGRLGIQKDIPHNVLQEYLESLADAGSPPDRAERKILLSYAELQYRLNGGGHCTVCHASVRHVLPVRVEHPDNSIADFQCLCTRCLEAERAVASRVILTVGKAVLVYTANGDKASKTQKFRASR